MIAPIKQLVLQRVIGGLSVQEAAQSIKVPYRTVLLWMKEPEVDAAFNEMVAEHRDLVEAMLLAGEREASKTLIEALSATNGKGAPDWPTRLRAAMSLLDRRGERGSVVSKQEVKGTVVTGDASAILAEALRDPGVRAWIEKDPTYRQLLPAPRAETVEAEVVTTSEAI